MELGYLSLAVVKCRVGEEGIDFAELCRAHLFTERIVERVLDVTRLILGRDQLLANIRRYAQKGRASSRGEGYIVRQNAHGRGDCGLSGFELEEAQTRERFEQLASFRVCIDGREVLPLVYK